MMTELYYQPEAPPPLSRKEQRQQSKQRKKENEPNDRKIWRIALLWTAVIVAWGALLYASYAYARQSFNEIQNELQQLQATNQSHVEALTETMNGLLLHLDEHQAQIVALKDQFAIVEDELALVKEGVALAEDSLHSSDSTKQTLSQRVTDLSKELESLRTLIRRLEEAARVY